MSANLLEVKLDEHNRGSVKLNGQEVQGVRALTFEAAVDRGNQVTLTFVNCQVDVRARAELKKVEVDLK